jgi:hypothetical protein
MPSVNQGPELLEKTPLRLTCRREHARALPCLHCSKPADVTNRGSFSFLHNGTFAGILESFDRKA